MSDSRRPCFRGKVSLIEGDVVYFTRGSSVYAYSRASRAERRLFALPVSLLDRFLSSDPKVARLTRRIVSQVLRMAPGLLGVVGYSQIVIYDEHRGQIVKRHRLPFRRPLIAAAAWGHIYYGAYTGNPERLDVRLYRVDGQHDASVVHTFHGVRHVHSVSHDPYTDNLWVTTGDDDEECGLWRIRRDGEPEYVVGGSQQLRVVQPLFTESHVLFGTDSPLEQNHIYRLSRDDLSVEKVCEVPNSVFYGCRVGGHVYFSTAAEPSEVNSVDEFLVVGSNDGGKNWRTVVRCRKDRLPFKLFQYGQVHLPHGTNDTGHLYYTPMGAAGADLVTFERSELL